jgi:hypothetical protein
LAAIVEKDFLTIHRQQVRAAIVVGQPRQRAPRTVGHLPGVVGEALDGGLVAQVEADAAGITATATGGAFVEVLAGKRLPAVEVVEARAAG